MVMRAATMNSFQSPTTSGEQESFMRKLAILLLLVINAVLGIVLWFQVDRELPLLLSTIFADITVGLVAGYGARIVYRRWNLAAQYLMAILMTVTGMMLLGALTRQTLGIGPLGLEREAGTQFRQLSLDSTLPEQLRELKIDPLALFDFSGMDVNDAAHLAGSLLLSLMSLMAWRGTGQERQVIDVEPLGHAQVEIEPRNVGVSLASERSNGSAVHAHPPITWFRSPAPRPAPRPRIRSRNRIKSAARSAAKSAKSIRRRSRSKAQIQLAVIEEHRCPFCLDPVSRNDARGVKECEVCHTLHHGDCWAITGFCQVPHLNT